MKTISKPIILIVVIILISQSIFFMIKTYQAVNEYERTVELTGKASGTIGICINTRPTINISDCSPNATQDVAYSCYVNASDSDYTNFTYFSKFAVIERAFNDSNNSFFSVDQNSGLVSFTPTNNDVGNFTIQFTVNDGIGCDNSEDSDYLYLRVWNVNDAPVFLEDIPVQQFREEGETRHAFYLDNHFSDPDLDPLNYSVISSSSSFTITINPITSLVTITANTCDVTSIALFHATDPYNATNHSNAVSMRCTTPSPSSPSPGGEGTGAGGGAGVFEECIPEYECYDYHKCNKSNVKLQKCVDTHGCENDVFLEVPCVYKEDIECNESWNCTHWEPCRSNGTQVRTCIDLNDCGTKDFMPALVQDCEYIGTCDDGIKNCHNGSCEEGVDCGGPCPACKSVEVPYPFEEERSILIYIVTGIILLIMMAVLLYHYFHKEINSALAKAGWLLAGRKKKQILLTADEKKELLSGVKDMESKLGTIGLPESLNKFSGLLRTYLVKACKDKKLEPEFNSEDLKERLEKSRRVKGILRNIFTSLFSRYVDVEQDKKLVKEPVITLLMEEIRNLVLQTSESVVEDAAREVKEYEAPDDAGGVEKLRVMLSNTYIALEFLELDVAKNKYLEVLKEYETLGLKEQEAVFNDISRLYHNISYVNSWLIQSEEG